MDRILVTAIGSFAGKQVIINLKKSGSYVIGCDIYRKEWIANSSRVDIFYQAPLATDESYIRFICKVCEEQSIKYIIPLTDLEVDVLNENREIFTQRGIVLCISDNKCIEICRNKYLLYCFFLHDKSIETIPTYLLEEVRDDEIVFPAIAKPYNGRSSQGIRYLYNKEELSEFRKQQDISKFIIQPKIDGNIITIDVVRNAQKESYALGRRELLRTFNGAGTSVQIFRDEDLEKKALEIADRLNVIGVVNFEFIEDKNGRRFFMECNPRFSGGVAFSCVAGYDFILNHMKCFRNENIDLHVPIREVYIARDYEEHIMGSVE